MNAVRAALLSLILLVPVACRDRVDTAPATTPTTVVTAPAPGDATGSLVTPDGRTRTYRVHVPAGLPDGEVPLLVALHGGTGSGQQFQRSSGFDREADEHGFIVVYPDGVGGGADETGPRTWNAGTCCGAAARKGVDDVGFVDQLIDALEADYPIDDDRVYAAGHSNGGFLSYRLACELSGRIAAVGLQAGGLLVPDCAPDRPVSLLHLHGADDTNVPIEGGVGSGISNVDFPPLADSLAAATTAMGCTGPPTERTDGPATITTWSPCDGGVTVELQVVDGQTHKWMSGSDFDSASTIVEFLLAH